jgi:lysophospholipase L1-like esterase
MTAVKKEWFVLSGVTLVTLAIALLLLRWLAPQLIGLPVDLRLVGVSDKLPPFYDGVFRAADYQTSEFILNDPITISRARPRVPEAATLGPHDILGFRNRVVPNVADVVIIGDSQTYGNNVALEDNWPSRLALRLEDKDAITYSMATGGWGAVQYLEMATKATSFQPQLLIVAFYSGNDSLESFRLAYSLDRFKDLRPVNNLDSGDTPAVAFPPPPETLWPVNFKDGVKTVFTPALRLAANDGHPAVKAGYGVMANVAREIHRLTRPFGTALIFTIIPTKEYVYAEKLRRENIEPTEEYRRLVAAEGNHISELAAALRAIPDATYVDLTAPLSKAAVEAVALYPTIGNGHPISAGYAVIADTLAMAAGEKVISRPRGLVAIPLGQNHAVLYLVKQEGMWRLPGLDHALKNGWSREQVQVVSYRSLAGLPRRGTLNIIDPDRFGPDAVR